MVRIAIILSALAVSCAPVSARCPADRTGEQVAALDALLEKRLAELEKSAAGAESAASAVLAAVQQGERAAAEAQAKAQAQQHVSCSPPTPDGGSPGKPVDLGVPAPCGGESLGMCLRGLPISEVEARCRAGKITK